jgi:hypothetical protein
LRTPVTCYKTLNPGAPPGDPESAVLFLLKLF